MVITEILYKKKSFFDSHFRDKHIFFTHIQCWIHFTSREKVEQLNYKGSQQAAASIGQSEKVQRDPTDVAGGQLEGYEGTYQRGNVRSVMVTSD